MTDEQLVWAFGLIVGAGLVLFNRQIVDWQDRIGPRWLRTPAWMSAVGRLIFVGFGLLLVGLAVLVLAGYLRSAPVVWPWE
jgi:hypothetical protein